jgi:hypothetical protein
MTYELVYKGPGFSLNDAYKLHWTKAKKKKDGLHLAFKTLLREANIPKLKAFTLKVHYNSRHDVDNIIPLLKVLIDQMRYSGLIAEDTKDIYRGLSITPDRTLPHNSYRLTIKAEKGLK